MQHKIFGLFLGLSSSCLPLSYQYKDRNPSPSKTSTHYKPNKTSPHYEKRRITPYQWTHSNRCWRFIPTPTLDWKSKLHNGSKLFYRVEGGRRWCSICRVWCSTSGFHFDHQGRELFDWALGLRSRRRLVGLEVVRCLAVVEQWLEEPKQVVHH